MPFNQILAKKIVGTAIKDGSKITISAATSTSTWTRPDEIAEEAGQLLAKSLVDYKQPLPQDTQEGDYHTSDNDSRDHITVVCFDSKGKGEDAAYPDL